MKERNYLFIVILLIVGLIVLGSISFWPTFWQESNLSSSEESQKVTTSEEKISQSSASIGYKVNVTYPKFSGLTNASVQETINSAIKSMMVNQSDEFKNAVSNADKTIPVTTGGELIISNKVSLANDNAVSVWFEVMNAVPGMAHPNNYNLVYNYDITEGKVLELSDLFTPGSNYLQTISEIAKKQLLAQSELKSVNGLDFFVDEGAGPKAENFKLFNLSNDNLILIFDPGTVAPEFAGTRTVEIPLSTLSPILNAPPVSPN